MADRQSRLDKARYLVFLLAATNIVYLNLIPKSWTATVSLTLAIIYIGALGAAVLNPLNIRAQLVGLVAGAAFWLVGIALLDDELKIFTHWQERATMASLSTILHLKVVPAISFPRGRKSDAT